MYMYFKDMYVNFKIIMVLCQMESEHSIMYNIIHC